MFEIKFLKDDEINGEKIKAGETRRVSRSIRNAKIASGVATDFIEEEIVATKKVKEKK